MIRHWAMGLASCLAALLLLPSPPARAAPPILGRGINIFPHSYDPIWSDRSKSPFRAETFAVIRDAGFRTVRLPLLPYTHMLPDGQLKPEFLNGLDWVVQQATAAGLNVIIDFHEFRNCAADAATCDQRMTAFWQQVAPRYASAPNSVLFELLNEPHGQITPDLYARLMRKELAIVRRTNPTRTVMICALEGGSIPGLDELQLPADPDIMADVHYYLPYHFTHQGSPESPEFARIRHMAWGSPSDYEHVNADMDRIAAWRAANGVPVYLGEFGTINTVDMPYRVAWTAAVARAAEARRIPWAYWEFSAEYGIYDLATQRWNGALLHALVP